MGLPGYRGVFPGSMDRFLHRLSERFRIGGFSVEGTIGELTRLLTTAGW